MHRAAFYIKSLSLVLIFMLVGACTSSDDDPANPPPINTFNIFFEEIPGENAIGVYSFNPDTGRSVERARHRQGGNLAFEMDTDREKQGYEFLAYVFDDTSDPLKNAVYLLDYDKDSGGRVRKLGSFSTEICSIFPRYTNTTDLGLNSDINLSELTNAPIVEIRMAASIGAACNSATNRIVTIEYDFSLQDSTKQIIIKEESLFVRRSLQDYTFREGSSERGRVLLVADDASGRLSLLDEEGILTWSVDIPNGANFIHAYQPTNNLVIMQADDELYVNTLLELAEANDAASSASTLQERVFPPTPLSLQYSDSTNPVMWATNSKNFVIQDGINLTFYDSETKIFETIGQLPTGLDSTSLWLTDGDELIVRQESGGLFELVRFYRSGNTWLESLNLVPSTNHSDLWVELVGNAAYISAKTSGINAMWSAYFYEEVSGNNNFTVYDNSLFIIPSRSEALERPTLILNSDLSLADGSLDSPSLYLFDSTRPGGIKLQQDGDGNIKLDQLGQAKPELIGSVSANVSSALFPGKTVNDEFVRFKLLFQTAEVANFFANPSDTDEPSLATMSAN